jgi:hypothetical protein
MLRTTPRTRSGRHTTRAAVATLGAVSVIAGSLAFTAIAATAADLPATVLDANTTWKYSDNNTDPAAGNADRLVWTKAGFDDAAWKSATGAFGAKRSGTGAAATVGSNLGNGFVAKTQLQLFIDPTASTKVDVPTEHFRSTFTVDSATLSAISGLEGTIVYDDAVQVFVNGIKVAGFADSDLNTVAEADKNLAYAGDSGGDPATSTFTVPAAALQAGTNTIAIALYQDRSDSSDLYLNVTSLVPVVKVVGAPTISDIVLGVGSDETQRNLSWYTSTDVAQVAEFAPSAEVVGGNFPASSTKIDATGAATTSGEFNRFATIAGLQPNTVYSYRVGAAGAWSATYSFRTQSFDGNFDFLFLGDPQIGSSGNIPNDTAGWQDTLDVATEAYPNTEMLFSSGDQVESAGNESHYTAFLTPDALRSIPFVATNGNHDVGSKAYEQHFNTPNVDRTAGAGSGSASGGNYWFIYKDVLFMDINSNSRDNASHIAWMNRIVAEQGANAKWKVLAFHHSIYSAGPHATDDDVKERRTQLPTAISELGIDLVLQGHDHSYARSYLLRNGEKADAAEQAGADTVTAGPGGVLYVTANSASGSKYYGLQASGFPWLSVSNQENVRNYTAVEVEDDAITVKTLRSQANGDKAVNSVVDQVTLAKAADPNSQEIEVTVPEGEPGEFAWNIDGTNGLVDLGTAVDSGDSFTASGAINPIRVTDTRLGGPQWSVSAQVSDFTSGEESFSGKYLGWTPRVLEEGAGAIAGAPVASGFDSGNGLADSSTLGHGPAAHPRGSAKLGADLSLKIPVDVTDGTYKATLTLTALS